MDNDECHSGVNLKFNLELFACFEIGFGLLFK